MNLNEFKKKNILVIGDIILDKYIFGKVERISPEAPVPIIAVEREKYVPGGAANAASNVAGLGGNAILMGIVGDDMARDVLIDEARKRGIDTQAVITDAKKPTIQKIRVVGQNQQLLRIDYEDNDYIEKDVNDKLLEKLEGIKKVDAIIISDYAKGTITRELMEKLKEYSKKRDAFLLIDPKPRHKGFYKGCSLITPNKKEAEELSGMHIETKEDLEKAGKRLIEELGCNVLITMGEKGMSLFEKNKQALHIPTVAKEVFDVSGAGDTVIATLSLAISSGASLKEAAILANYAAGIKVGKLGTATVSISELKASLENG